MATIKDVARLAGVGVGTASRVVSGRGSVAAATAERVRKAIVELEFRPSHAARSLLTGSSQMIGVYIPMLKGTFYTPILFEMIQQTFTPSTFLLAPNATRSACLEVCPTCPAATSGIGGAMQVVLREACVPGPLTTWLLPEDTIFYTPW